MEILAPAGDEAMLRAAVYSGADCVYVGVEGFNARRGAANFGEQALKAAVAFCHARGCGVYAALNTVVLPGEEAAALRAVRAVANAGCDAVIVQDIGLAKAVRTAAPGLALHASTQTSIHSAAGVRAMAALGFSRVILARELSFAEIGEIAHTAREVGVELEVFVHGALCVCVSGQCYMSAFLGGRSANRGACAGPCRLPFTAAVGETGAKGAAAQHLSLKDLSVLDELPRLAALGVVSAKIEGRLRGPEYCAVVVDAAQKALRGESYDKALLQDVFSRSGFTAAWPQGKIGKEMFGTRTTADSAAAKKALPKARELYRRERPRVPVKMALRLSKEGGALVVSDGKHRVETPLPGPLAAAEGDAASALRAALCKTGGTPFAPAEVAVEANGLHLPAAVANAARRTALEELMALRSIPPTPLDETTFVPLLTKAAPRAPKTGHGAPPVLRARFENLEQVPHSAAAQCEELLLPLFEADKVPKELRAKTRLWLPRVLFGPLEGQAAQRVEAAKTMGFLGFEVQNPAHWVLCAGQNTSGGFGLNITNAWAAASAFGQGVARLTLSPELSLAQMRDVVAALPQNAPATDALAYGHMPLMVTRACPLQNVAECATCPRSGTLADRKGEKFPVHCRHGVRSIYNPVPLWMADRLAELPTGSATLYFTTESKTACTAVLAAFQNGEKAPGPFTRGLYTRGVAVGEAH